AASKRSIASSKKEEEKANPKSATIYIGKSNKYLSGVPCCSRYFTSKPTVSLGRKSKASKSPFVCKPFLTKNSSSAASYVVPASAVFTVLNHRKPIMERRLQPATASQKDPTCIDKHEVLG